MHFSTNGLRAGGLTAPRRVTAESSHPQGRGPGSRRVGAVARHVNGAILRQQPHKHREQRQLEGPEVNSMCHRIPMDLALNTWGASWGPRPVLVQPVAKDGFYIFQKWGGKGPPRAEELGQKQYVAHRTQLYPTWTQTIPCFLVRHTPATPPSPSKSQLLSD